jgi:6,7-dimethyl-8-ribityllumazine synthase
MARQDTKNTAVLNFTVPPHVLILEARFYDSINDMLVEGAKNTLAKFNATYEIITVPGALEIPAALQFAATRKTGRSFDAFVALGCVIRGETSHYETVCNESARGLIDVSLRHNLAVGNGILTVENDTQAIARADLHQMDKGGGAVVAALSMLALKQASGL